MATCLLCSILFITFTQVVGLPELGVWHVVYNKENNIHGFSKSVFDKTRLEVSINCEAKEKITIDATWIIRYTPCAQEYDGIEAEPDRQMAYKSRPAMLFITELEYKKVEFMSSSTAFDCGDGQTVIFLHNPPLKPTIMDTVSVKTIMNESNSEVAGQAVAAVTTQKPKSRRRRADENVNPPQPPKASTAAPKETTTTTTTTTTKDPHDMDHTLLTSFWRDGYTVFILELKSRDNKNFSASVDVRMPGPHGYISAVEFPLEIFYGVMGLVYIVYGVVWLVLLGCNWRDLLRVQFWIEGVIILGMLEKAVFFAEYESIAKSGESVRGAIIVAELVSSMKRALARMLVIVVSLGFGIVKPRLGQTFHKVLCVGVMYFVLGSIEGCMRALKKKSDQSNELMLAAVPLAVLDAVICWWIFSSLVQTTRTLRLRRNVVKLSLYRHFTNTLIFAVLASIAYMIWSITQHKLKACITDWRELWVDEAFWHLLFSVLLLIIMILWRPTVNNQRYAFSPLLDAAEDDVDDDTVMNDAFDGMKMRTKNASNGSPKQRETRKSVEDDLKWVEENIPSSISDKALPSLLDSDEELQNTHFEISKME